MEAIEMNHPLITHKVSLLRDKKTGTKEFRELTSEIAMLVCYEAFRNEKLHEVDVETPIEKTKGAMLNEDEYVFLPILRAGMGMAEGIMRLIPNAKFGHIGMSRNEETLVPERYYYKVPDGTTNKKVFIIDPMLATGGSAIDAISVLKAEGVKDIKFLCMIAAPEGIKKVQETYPDVQIYCAKIDKCLNEVGYIVPGLGDAGDRIFGTK